MRNSLTRNENAPEHGVILYGPPASGKDTINAALTELSPAYSQFRRIKVGQGRTGGYRMISAVHLAELTERGEILYRNHRYSAVYAVDRSGLLDMVDAHQIPVVHLGQIEGVQAVVRALPRLVWTVVEPRCPRDVAERRIAARGTGDIQERLEAWDATERLGECGDLRIDTATTAAAAAALLVDAAVRRA